MEVQVFSAAPNKVMEEKIIKETFSADESVQKITNYLDACNFLTSKGIKVIRMGKNVYDKFETNNKMIIDINSSKIKNDKRLSNLFVNTNFSNLSINCNILKGNFFSDSFYYFPITENNETFSSLFTRDLNNISHFYSQKFFDNFKDNKNSLKKFKELYVLGSNAGNNYYSNLLQFLPRIFFNKKTNLKLAIHRNSSNKYRNFIGSILKSLNIEFTFVFLDDDFYHFLDSEFPQFLSTNDSIDILKKFINPKTGIELSKKIYVTREDSNYRKILNEDDVVTILRKNGYRVINPQLYEIDEQLEIFSNAEKIIAPHGSNLANIIFCKPGTEIFEITPSFKDNEKILEDRYLNLSLINNLKHNKIVSDTVNVENHSNLAKKYIHKNVLSQSNYYKNLIVKIQELSNII